MPNGPLRNPYQSLLSGHFAARYEEIRGYSAEELLMANFQAIQALLAWELDGNRVFEGEKRTVMAALEVLVEQEQISAEYAQFVRMTLAGWSVERLAQIASQAQNLPLTAARLRQDGDTQAQVKVLQRFLVDVMTMVDDRDVRTLGMQAITRLKLEGGMSQESLNQMLSLIQVGDERRAAQEAAEEDEEDVVEVDSEGVDEEE